MSNNSSPVSSSNEDKSSDEDLLAIGNLMKCSNLLDNDDLFREFSRDKKTGSVSSRREVGYTISRSRRDKDQCYARSMTPPSYINSLVPPAPSQSPCSAPVKCPAPVRGQIKMQLPPQLSLRQELDIQQKRSTK